MKVIIARSFKNVWRNSLPYHFYSLIWLAESIGCSAKEVDIHLVCPLCMSHTLGAWVESRHIEGPKPFHRSQVVKLEYLHGPKVFIRPWLKCYNFYLGKFKSEKWVTISLNCLFPANADFVWVPYDTVYFYIQSSSQSFFIIIGSGMLYTQLCNVPALMCNTFILKYHL